MSLENILKKIQKKSADKEYFRMYYRTDSISECIASLVSVCCQGHIAGDINYETLINFSSYIIKVFNDYLLEFESFIEINKKYFQTEWAYVLTTVNNFRQMLILALNKIQELKGVYEKDAR